MTPARTTGRTDPLAPLGLLLAIVPFALRVTGDLDWRWHLGAALAGGVVGQVSLARIRRSDGRLGGRGLAIAASILGLGLVAVIVVGLAAVLAIFVAAGSG